MDTEVGTATTVPRVPRDPGFARLCRIVRERTGLDLGPYKRKFLERRIAIRLRATRSGGVEEYLPRLAAEPGEMNLLLGCLTIHVSTFFRNPTTFEAIRTRVLPALFPPGAVPRRVKVWSVGCARGEEPYSLAILIREHLGEEAGRWDVRIHAIDVDDRVLLHAKAAEYSPQQVADLAPELARRYFTCDGRWQLAPEVRRMVHFHRRDVLLDPPERDYDCIVCRNLLIYLEREAQERILGRFAAALRPGGFLVLGRTEVFVGPERARFSVVDAQERIYRRLAPGETHPSSLEEPAPAAEEEHP